MRLKYNQTKRGKCFYIIRSVYKDGKNTSETYERLGYLDEIKQERHCDDPEKWMQDYLGRLNELEKTEKKHKNTDSAQPHHPGPERRCPVLQCRLPVPAEDLL